MEQPQALTAPDVVRAVWALDRVRLDVRRLGYWAAQGVVVPSVRWEHCRGVARLYSVRDLALVRLVVRLRERGDVALWNIKPVLAYLAEDLAAALRPGTTTVLVMDGWRVWLVSQREASRVAGQYRLALTDVLRGNAALVRRYRRAHPLRATQAAA